MNPGKWSTEGEERHETLNRSKGRVMLRVRRIARVEQQGTSDVPPWDGTKEFTGACSADDALVCGVPLRAHRTSTALMDRSWTIFLLLVGSLALGSSASAQVESTHWAPPVQDTSAAERAALEAAQEWLRHVDAGAWETAWNAAAPRLRDSVDQEQWRQRGTQARRALGPLRSRQLVRIQSHEAPAETPEAGPFVHLRYHSTFGSELYVETVVATNADEAWRVAGYEVALVAQGPLSRPGGPK